MSVSDGSCAQAILNLKKLCNHPKLIFDALSKGSKDAAGFEVSPRIAQVLGRS